MKYLMLTLLLLMAIAGPAQAHCGKNRVYVYGARWCPACRATERFLTSSKVAYKWIEVNGSRQVQKLMREKFGMIAIPVVVIDGRHRLGYDPRWLRKALCIP